MSRKPKPEVIEGPQKCSATDQCGLLNYAIRNNGNSEKPRGIGWQLYYNFNTGNGLQAIVYRARPGVGTEIRMIFCPFCGERLYAMPDQDSSTPEAAV